MVTNHPLATSTASSASSAATTPLHRLHRLGPRHAAARLASLLLSPSTCSTVSCPEALSAAVDSAAAASAAGLGRPWRAAFARAAALALLKDSAPAAALLAEAARRPGLRHTVAVAYSTAARRAWRLLCRAQQAEPDGGARTKLSPGALDALLQDLLSAKTVSSEDNGEAEGAAEMDLDAEPEELTGAVSAAADDADGRVNTLLAAAPDEESRTRIASATHAALGALLPDEALSPGLAGLLAALPPPASAATRLARHLAASLPPNVSTSAATAPALLTLARVCGAALTPALAASGAVHADTCATPALALAALALPAVVGPPPRALDAADAAAIAAVLAPAIACGVAAPLSPVLATAAFEEAVDVLSTAPAALLSAAATLLQALRDLRATDPLAAVFVDLRRAARLEDDSNSTEDLLDRLPLPSLAWCVRR